MGVITTTQELTSSIPPCRLFKALYLDNHNLFPKILPQHIKSVEVLQGDGGVGTIKQTNFTDGSRFKFWKSKIEAIDVDNYYVKSTMFEGDVLGDKFEKITVEVKFESSGTGSITKISNCFHTKPGVELTPEEIEGGKEKTTGFYKAAEEYLTSNPTVYA